MRNYINLVLGMTLLFVVFSCKNQNKKESTTKKTIVEVDYLNESKADFNKRMKWWRDARFGMFIHWGPYAVAAGTHNGKKVKGIGEWIMHNAKIPVAEYETYAKQFNPVSFNADAWVKVIKDAGMKYLVITSKHHDGFSLWDSKVSKYDIMDFSPYGKDILKALSKSCKEQGIKFGLYHSIIDWHHPKAHYNAFLRDKNDKTDYKESFKEYLKHYMKPQLKELIEDYDPEILWFDGDWISEFTHEQGQELYQYVRSLKPSILINNRVDKGRQGYQGMNKTDKKYAGDFGTPEQEILEKASETDWESCMTMNDTWGYKSYDHNWKSPKNLIYNLIDIVAKGGNYLLNVGPSPEGNIPEPSIDRLKIMGDWLGVNGEAIYNTERLSHHYKQGETIRYTKQKGDNIYYALVLKELKNEIIFKYVQPDSDSKIYLLGLDTPLDWIQTKEGIKVSVPKTAFNNAEKTNAWVFKIKGKEKKQ